MKPELFSGVFRDVPVNISGNLNVYIVIGDVKKEENMTAQIENNGVTIMNGVLKQSSSADIGQVPLSKGKSVWGLLLGILNWILQGANNNNHEN